MQPNIAFDAIDIIGISLISIGVLVLTPMLLYSLYAFYRIDTGSSDLIKYRNKTLVCAMNGLAVLSFCSERIFIISTQVLRIPDGIIPEYVCFIGVYLFIFGFYTLFIIKTWLSYYLREYHRKLVELTWCKDVNPLASKDVQNEWFIKYKHKLGDYKYLIKISALPFLLFILIETIIDTTVSETPIDHIITLLYTLFIFVVSFILYYKTRDFNDIYHIKQEIQYQTLLLFLIVFINIFSVTMQIIYDIKHSGHDDMNAVCIKTTMKCDTRRIEWLITSVIGYVSLFSISLISTAFPVFLYKTNAMTNRIKHSQSIDQRTNKKQHFLNKMLKIISNEYGFKAFMVHLIKEYSTENMLFILELIQIKSQFQTRHNNVLKLPKCIDLSTLSNDSTATDSKAISPKKMTVNFNIQSMEPTSPKTPSTDLEERHSNSSNTQTQTNKQTQRRATFFFNEIGSIFCKIILPDNLPQSAIINAHLDNICQQMKCLYAKYIKTDSKFELNISYKQRIGLTNLFENNLATHIKSEFDIFNIFDECAIEVLKLSFNSFQRFKETVAYKEIKTKISNKANNKKHEIIISNVSADFDLDAIHSEDSYNKILALYPTNSASLQSASSMSIN